MRIYGLGGTGDNATLPRPHQQRFPTVSTAVPEERARKASTGSSGCWAHQPLPLLFILFCMCPKALQKKKKKVCITVQIQGEQKAIRLFRCFILFVSCSQALRPDRHLLPACREHGPTAGSLDVSEFPGNPHQKPPSL